MGSTINKSFSLLFILILTVSSLLMAKPASALPTPTLAPTPSASSNQFPTPTPTAPNTTPQPTPNIDAINKLPVPEFSVRLVEGPYDVPSSYVISLSGKNFTIPGVHIAKRAVVITIKNPPFTPYHDVNSGWNISFYYNVRMKLHSAENWTTLNSAEDLPLRTDSQYTTLVISPDPSSYTIGAQVDFQVIAMEGYVHRAATIIHSGDYTIFYPYVFTGQTSDWSSTQTVTIYGDIPNLTFLTPQNTCYSTSSIPLTFTVDKPVSQINYSLDNQANVTIQGNTTLDNLPSGLHNVTIYAVDNAGHTGASQTINFTIVELEPFPTLTILAIVSIIGVIIVAVALLYLRKQRLK